MTKKDSDDGGGFIALGLDPRLIEGLTGLGYEEPTPVQRETIPPLLEGRDLVGQAATGTGKTAAFALPVLHRLAARAEGRRSPAALILVPTRELAMQVAEAVHRYGRPFGVSVLPIYGGQAFSQQLRVLQRGVDVVVATPGRALDHIKRGTLRLDEIEVVVLDEADEMLDMGFAEDLEAILAATPEERQTVLFSATLPPRIAAIARRHLRDAVEVKVIREKLPEGALPRVRQAAYVVPRAHKSAALGRVLEMEDPDAAIVFCRTRNEVDALAERVAAYGYRAEAIHGGMTQEQRDRVMKKLRSGAADLLIATDVAARGLDVPQLTHVINYDLPAAPESYVHRIGRVGRAGREGVAITLVEPREHRMLRSIEQLTKRKIDVEPVPTVADLRARRLEVVRGALRETLLGGELDGFRVVVESLADEFDPMEIAMAAVKLVQETTAADGEAEEEIPAVAPSGGGRERQARQKREHPGGRAAAERERPGQRRRSPADVARLYIGVGREAGVRPQDLVGAITGEAGISGGEIGAIHISQRHSVVEVAEEVAAGVMDALRLSTIKGKKVKVRRDREEGR